MKLHIIIILSIAVIFFSCQEKSYYAPDKIKYVSTIGKYDNLNGEIIPISILGIYHINTIDSLLIFLTRNPDGFVSLVNTKNDSLICSVCCKGKGPNEYLLPNSLKQYNVNDNKDRLLYLTDNLTQVKALNLTQTIQNNVAICNKPINISLTRQIPFFLPENNLFLKHSVSYDDPRDKIFYPPKYIHKNKDKEKEYNIYPIMIDNEKYSDLPSFIYEGILRIKPDLTKVVDAAVAMNNINILNLKTGKSIGVIEDNTPFFNELMILSYDELLQKMKYCAIDVSVTDNYIMILYDGRTVYEADNQKKIIKPTLKIFNWEGDFIRGYQFSEPLNGIAYNENNQCLYGFDTEDKIYRYQLTVI